MAYVNFNEENFVANNQLKKRKENNKNIIERMIKNKKSLTSKYNEKYSFVKTESKVIFNLNKMKEDDFLEISNENIVCAEFVDCKFYNIRFINCYFIGCSFINCDFAGGGVVFENCIFIKVETDKTPSLNIKDNLSCGFYNCNMYAKFFCCNASFIIFEECRMRNISFELTDMTYDIIINSSIDGINLSDVDLGSSKIISTYIENLEFNDKLNSRMDEKTFFDKIPLKKKTREEYEGIYKIYETIADKFKQNNLSNNFGEYYYLCKNVQRKSLKILPRIGSYINWATCGYGERVSAPLVSSLIIIIFFAIVYLVLGVEIQGEIVKLTFSNIGGLSFKTIIGYINEAITLSVGMFAAVGMVNSGPIPASYLIADIEMLIGVTMMGIGIGTLTRKIVR